MKNKKGGNNNNNNSKNKKTIFTSNIICLVDNINLLKNNINFPKFTYNGSDGFKTISFILNYGESIRADGGAMNYMSSNITIQTQAGSIFNGIGRFFSGSTIFYNIFSNNTNISSEIMFSQPNIGSIGCFYIPAGKCFDFVSNTYICSTPNLDISTDLKLGGLLTGYGITFVKVTAKETSGLVWISSFGNVIDKVIETNQSIMIDNDIILGFDSDISIHTRSVGGLKSFLFSNECLVSEITNNGNNPIHIYLQSKSEKSFKNYIIPKR